MVNRKIELCDDVNDLLKLQTLWSGIRMINKSFTMAYFEQKNKRFFFWLIITLLLAILPWFIL
jgi:hypothetical protein